MDEGILLLALSERNKVRNDLISNGYIIIYIQECSNDLRL